MNKQVNKQNLKKIEADKIVFALEKNIASYRPKQLNKVKDEKKENEKEKDEVSLLIPMQKKVALKQVILSETDIPKVHKGTKPKKTLRKSANSLKTVVLDEVDTIKVTAKNSKHRKVLSKGLSNSFKVFLTTYKRHLVTTSLYLSLFIFVGLSTYAAYAYIAVGNTDIVQKVSAHVLLPFNETPKVYIIQSEKSEIFQNPLFKGIEVGDNVLSYVAAGKVYIYRSSLDKIINVVSASQ